MSLESWKKEFMPIDAKEAAAEGLGPAIAHSLHSWKGMLWVNAERHELKVERLWLIGQDGSMIKSVGECALCQMFFDGGCHGCPLKRNGEKCYFPNRGYKIMEQTSNPEVMIQELEEVWERWKAQQG